MPVDGGEASAVPDSGERAAVASPAGPIDAASGPEGAGAIVPGPLPPGPPPGEDRARQRSMAAHEGVAPRHPSSTARSTAALARATRVAAAFSTLIQRTWNATWGYVALQYAAMSVGGAAVAAASITTSSKTVATGQTMAVRIRLSV